MSGYFFDAYALVAISSARESYEPYRDEAIVTERGHVYEFARFVLKSRRARDVLPAVAALRARRIEPTDEDFLAAAKLARQNARLSAHDALGYVVARRAGLKFLTGDAAFNGLPGVEFTR